NACEGAHAAHELRGPDGRLVSLVHRDLSPHNIMITHEGAVKVVDFGIAKAVGRTSMTLPGHRKGKLPYMSPEQVRGEEIDRRTEVYALGLVLYEATTGTPVFKATQYAERVMNGFVEPPSMRCGDYPPALEAIVLCALEPARERRYETAREMAGALEKLL